ncbi:MAG TPA: TRAP transporter small permease [Devosia sp.]|uniref:TRAP transporter small permease n=1 Tax=Devosia sp. TaxID=1871048 RepID=UPI002DDCF54A|nr:TRAP transporter small permease [Devosia sp.]HEV2514173.1 TRAP transporter small permease [Devosia sp.]
MAGIDDLTAARPRLRKLGRALSALSTAALYLAGFFLVLMTLFVGWQVFTRYVLNWSNAWTEPAAVFLMSWFIFLGSAVGIRENYHLGFDVLLYVLPKSGKKYLRTISDLVVLAFALGMVVYGMQLVLLSWAARMPTLGIPEGAKYLSVVAGGALIVIFALERLVLRWSGVDIDADVDLDLDAVPDTGTVKEV